MRKITFVILFIAGFVLLLLSLFLFVGSATKSGDLQWGVNFSKKHAVYLGLDWQEVYRALLDDIEVRRLKLSLDWDELAPEQGTYDFSATDWMIQEAEKRESELLLVVGMKTTRYPECHIPDWAKNFSKEEQQEEILKLLEAVVTRYTDTKAVVAWQVENEPFFPFGICPWRDKDFLKKEVQLVKALDSKRPVIISDSGEWSFWIEAARIGDKVSSTMYRNAWVDELNRYITYPFPSVYYARKALYIDALFGKEIIGGEVQAEPWGPGKLLYHTTIEEQDAVFDIAQFRDNIRYAKRTGFSEFYLWGAEWWYWRKEKAGDPTFWNAAKNIFDGAQCVTVEVADTLESRIQGLSGRDYLDENHGMLFVDEISRVQEFWMKDMILDIDIIWLDDNFKTVGIEANVTPDTFPKKFQSPEPVRYVLEVNAGWAERNDITQGSEICLIR